MNYEAAAKALYAAYVNGDKDLIRLSIGSSQSDGMQIQRKLLNLLIDAGPNLDISDDALTDALETALHAGHASLARRLLAKGPSLCVHPRYAVQLEEVESGNTVLTNVEPECIEPE